jgi:hypothetical protein
MNCFGGCAMFEQGLCVRCCNYTIAMHLAATAKWHKLFAILLVLLVKRVQIGSELPLERGK